MVGGECPGAISTMVGSGTRQRLPCNSEHPISVASVCRFPPWLIQIVD
jgi:hypothetical protein